MRSFEGQNFYQILQVSPNAALSDIKQAYRDALDLYEEDSLATLSLFSDEQRAELLRDIETAFLTLIDDDKRSAYNEALFESEQLERADLTSAAPKKSRVVSPGSIASKISNLDRWVAKKSSEPEIRKLAEKLVSDDPVTGRDLKQLREALGIEISEIYEITKISPTNISLIEQDRFKDLPAEIYLKMYLRSYAEILQIDPTRIVDGYLQYMKSSKMSST
jgi:curved DNA-binding protein CbpA